MLLLAPCFPLVGHHRLPLCYSSLPCVAPFCSVGFLLLASFPCFALLCPWPLVLLLAFLRYFRLLRLLSLSLFLSCSSLRSLGGPPVPSWPSVISLAFAPLWVLAREVLFLVSRVSAPRVWGFGWSPSCFLFEPRCFPFFPLGPRAMSGYPVCPLPRPFLSSFWWLCLSSVCSAPSFSCPGFTVISLVLPLLVIALSLCLLALLFVLFLGLSSLFLAVSFLMLPRLPLPCLSVGASWYVCR